MRILHVFDHSIPLHSGYTFRSLSILRGQRNLGWHTFHLTSPKQNSGDELENDVEGWHFYRTPAATGLMAKLPVLGEISLMNALERRLEEVVEKIKPDILHAHSPVLNALPALRVGERHGIPVVYEVRAFWEDAAVDHGTCKEGGLRYRLTRSLETYVFKRADAVTTICEGLRSDIVGRGIPAEKVTVIPNAVNIEEFTVGGRANLVLVSQLGLTGKTVIGFIGSFYAYEGLDILLKAFPLMLARNPDVRVLLVGGGPEEDRLKAMATGLGVADKVVFTGRVPHAQVQHYYDLLDVLVYPRLSMRLTDLVTPLKPLESMAQGRLLAASDVGGHHELIRDNETGVLFKSGSPQALSDRVLDLLAHPERWQGLKDAGRRFVETERNWSVSVGRYPAVYAGAQAAQAKKSR